MWIKTVTKSGKSCLVQPEKFSCIAVVKADRGGPSNSEYWLTVWKGEDGELLYRGTEEECEQAFKLVEFAICNGAVLLDLVSEMAKLTETP